ncbi:Nif3-like dinuclear metal center hexameric protein [Aquimarina muelleri]|uniref:GTP cyclohydrolase 1 type 2 homolog n=1 Tax=Aquimarina muelleri TaxID=279356 RepID=A0A918JUT0_9FLAO|nr:Nif3-like dinuclear metal center hexameric protein [Aquimarina muelleri]MCX2762518.1 Nif3-like dinuclear metal center hexameric protein [Aquimarina muelleri]GGX20297.1 GTP cyclohydrolase 1 type 2 [Aquimarina muelleri]
MQIKEVIEHLEDLAPTAYAEDFDNIGLLVGEPKTIVTGILVTLDTLEETIDEAIQNSCNLIISFHPIIFKGIKKFNGTNYVERVVIKAIKNDISIFAIHTALDNTLHGVNNMICEQLGLINRKILIPQSGNIKKLVTFTPINQTEELLNKLFEAGAGTIGNYTNCSFLSNGIGSFKPTEIANPVIGEIGKLHKEKETQIQITYPRHCENKILKALFENHSYEEVAYEITTLENKNQNIGIGMIGELTESIEEIHFLKHIKKVFNSGCVRHSSLLNKPIKKVAVLGGSGSFAITNAIHAEADIFITADLKYHQFYEAEGKLILADIGHYESEQYTKNLIVSYLQKKISNFAIILSDKNTNPIQYI